MPRKTQTFIYLNDTMNILLTNDDGYTAKGLDTLVNIMRHFGRVTVISPKFAQSGMSTAVSLGHKRIAYKYLGEKNGARWSYLDATPASCVKYALHYLFDGVKPDLVVSGINHGSNASTAACYSGTLGAAEEAALNMIPSIGVSIDAVSPDADFTVVEELLPGIIEKLIAHHAGCGVYFNINFPAVSSKEEIKGIRVCEMGFGRWEKEFNEVEEADGEKIYVMTGTYKDYEFSPEKADNKYIDNGYVAIVPHNILNTDKKEAAALEAEGFNIDF